MSDVAAQFDARRSTRAARRVLGFSALVLAGVAFAQSGGGYDLRWNTQDSGGSSMSGANGYVLVGTVAQPDSNPAGALNGGGGYALRGGFWVSATETIDAIFGNSFETAP